MHTAFTEMSMGNAAITLDRVIEKVRELEARVRALEREADNSRHLEDIRSSISMIADRLDQDSASATALAHKAHRPDKQNYNSRNARNEEDKIERPVNSAGVLACPQFRSI
jgi:hypothetical protein